MIIIITTYVVFAYIILMGIYGHVRLCMDIEKRIKEHKRLKECEDIPVIHYIPKELAKELKNIKI